MSVRKVFRRGLIAAVLLCGGERLFALDCKEVSKLTDFYFKMHYSFDQFDDELSGRTLDNFIKVWDSQKLYFYASDIDEFRKVYGKKFDDIIPNSDCTGIDFIMNRYSQRFMERQAFIKKAIAMKHDFTVDEYLEVDRKSMNYAKSSEELDERWRKRVKLQILDLKPSVPTIEKIREKLVKRYELLVKRHNELTKDNVYGAYLNAFAMALDPHTSYMPPDDVEDFRIRTRLSLEGIGASLRSEDGYTIVANLVKGGAAEKGGILKENDKIIAVGQGDSEAVDVVDWDLQEVVKKIRGPRGTTVKLTVLRESPEETKKIIIPIVREKIQLVEQQASSKTYNVETNASGAKETLKVGVITLPSFYIDFEGKHRKLKDYRSSARDTAREIERLKRDKVDAIILDLRNNGGGGLEESVDVAGLFFDKGPVVQQKFQSSRVEVLSDDDDFTHYKGPLLVLINRNSASASEIVAGAIQDYGRGLIVGDSHTFGKGTVQNLNDVPGNLGAVKVTVAKYYRPSGKTTQIKGVDADIRLPSIMDELEVGEKFYDYALPYETIKKLSHESFNYIKPYTKTLADRAEKRIASNDDFKKINDEIKAFKDKETERNRISLKEKPVTKEEVKPADDKTDKALKDAEDGGETDEETNLADDVYLQESLKIAGDYVQLFKGKKLGDVALPELVAMQAKKDAPAVTDKTKTSDTTKKKN
jgi:carboxyl-terminal processing protease